MPFMQRLQSALILKTSLHQIYETNILEHPEKKIYKAIEQNNIIRIQEKIYDGYDVDLVSSHHLPVIIYATIHNRVDCINLFLENGANINICDKNGRTALHFAVNLCLYELIYLLLKYGANSSFKDHNNLSPLDYALNYQDKKSIKLLETTIAISLKYHTIEESIQHGSLYELSSNLKSKNELLKKNSLQQSYMYNAILTGDIKLMSYLFNKGFQIDEMDSKGNTPLLFAILSSAPLYVIKFLCHKGASIEVKNRYGESPLLTSLKLGLHEIADFLIDFGANVNVTENINTSLTLCHFAIHTFTDGATEFRDIQTKLIAKGATVEIAINKLKWTPLMHCVTQKELPLIKDHFEVLIQLGANPNKADLNGRTALMLGASVANRYYIQRLIENYADVNLVDNFGWSALVFAIYYSHVDILKELLDANSAMNIVTNSGQTLMQIALQKKNEQMIQLLKEYGAIME
jgi:ankyrin repeat protein